MKQIVICLILVLLMACGRSNQHSEIFAPGGKAIKGYDAVAFFVAGKPVAGNDSWSYSWKGAEWLFSSKENLESFSSDPEKYAPQYGGYCAYGTANGHKAPTETDTWTIVDNKLYFNYSSKVKEMWLKDQKALIEKADKNWPSVKLQN
jgi:YHS domain-containing protein